MLAKLKSFRWGYILIGFVLAAVGVCFIAVSEDALKYLAIAIGAILCVFAAVFAVLAIADKKRGVGFAFKIFFAAIALIAGIITIVKYRDTIDVIIAVISLILIIDSSFKLNTSAMSKRYKVIGWWFITSISIISIAMCFFLMKYTPASVKLGSVLLGIAMILNAINNILSAFYTQSFEHRMEDEISDKLAEEEAEIKAALEPESGDIPALQVDMPQTDSQSAPKEAPASQAEAPAAESTSESVPAPNA